MDWQDNPALSVSLATAGIHAAIHLASLAVGTSLSTLMATGWIEATIGVFLATFVGYKAIVETDLIEFENKLVSAGVSILLISIGVGAAHIGIHILVGGGMGVGEYAFTKEAGTVAALSAGFLSWIVGSE